MSTVRRHLLICAVACLAALGLSGLALTVMVPDADISYATELPRSAVTVPMIAVVVFWAIVRACGVPLAPVRSFLFGAIAVYGLFYVVGRLISVAEFNPALTLAVSAALLFALAFAAIRKAADDPVRD